MTTTRAAVVVGLVSWVLTACSGGAPATDGGSAGGAGGGAAGGAGGGAGGGTASVACTTGGAPITALPACSTAAGHSVNVGPGCTPAVDGTLHAEEWSDGTCFNVGANDTVVVAKYDANFLYLATSGIPSCGCPMLYYFDPDGSGSAPTGQFAISIFDDPSATDGDRTDFQWRDGGLSMAAAPAGIVTVCPGMQPNPIRYEWKIPFSALHIVPGTAHTFRMAVVHSQSTWPVDLVVGTNKVPLTEATWGTMSSTSNWH